MKYCSNCGHEVVFRTVAGDTHQRFVCEKCNTIHYQNPKIVTGCLPIWEDKVLLCKRAIAPRYGFWNVPGGYMENGESVEEGAMREVWEEACAHVEIEGLLTMYSIPHINQVYLHFYGKLPELDYAPGEESLEVALFEESNIPWDQIAFSSSAFALRAYFANRKAGQYRLHRGVFAP